MKITLFAAVAATALALGAPSSGAPEPHAPAHDQARAADAPKGWSPYRSEAISYDAGDVCPFAIDSTPVFDREFVRTPRTYPSGDPKRQAYSGPLVVRVTNQGSGRSVVRDLSAYGTFDYGRDGSTTFSAYGPVGVGFHRGDDLSPGFYVLRGYHRVRFTADGHVRVLTDRGSEENVCDALR